MSPELAKKRQRWLDRIKPGALVRFNQWTSGYTNKAVLVISVEARNDVDGRLRSPPTRNYYTILVDEHKRLVYQDFISPLDGWGKIDRK